MGGGSQRRMVFRHWCAGLLVCVLVRWWVVGVLVYWGQGGILTSPWWIRQLWRQCLRSTMDGPPLEAPNPRF